MKNNQNSNKALRKKLILKFEHIVQLSAVQLHEIHGGSSINDSCDYFCTKPK